MKSKILKGDERSQFMEKTKHVIDYVASENATVGEAYDILVNALAELIVMNCDTLADGEWVAREMAFAVQHTVRLNWPLFRQTADKNGLQ